MDNREFVQKLKDTAEYKTTYMWGTFGAPVKEAAIAGKSKQYPNWYTSSRQALLRGLIGRNYFAFDCVGLIKAILWGWSGNASKSYGGASYVSNGVPDIGADTMIARCNDVSTDFTAITPGEAVWMTGHIGVYIGDGKVVECTPAWENGVQVTACLNVGLIMGMVGRKWTKHGKLPYVSYVPDAADAVYRVVAGDTLGKIAAKAGMTVSELAAINHISDPNKIEVGQIIVLNPKAGRSKQ